jgi:hypothetical protein
MVRKARQLLDPPLQSPPDSLPPAPRAGRSPVRIAAAATEGTAAAAQAAQAGEIEEEAAKGRTAAAGAVAAAEGTAAAAGAGGLAKGAAEGRAAAEGSADGRAVAEAAATALAKEGPGMAVADGATAVAAAAEAGAAAERAATTAVAVGGRGARGPLQSEIAISGPHAIPGLLLLVETLSVDKKARRRSPPPCISQLNMACDSLPMQSVPSASPWSPLSKHRMGLPVDGWRPRPPRLPKLKTAPHLPCACPCRRRRVSAPSLAGSP